MARSGNTWFKLKLAKIKKANQQDDRRYAVQVQLAPRKEVAPINPPTITVMPDGRHTPASGKAGRVANTATYGNGERKWVAPTWGDDTGSLYRMVGGKMVRVG